MIDKTFSVKKNIGISIINNTALISVPNGENEKIKTVKLDTLIQAFQKFGLGTETPILPRNCIKYKEKGGNIVIVLAYSPSKFNATMSIDRSVPNSKPEVFENCPRPSVLMMFEMRKNDDESFYLNQTRAYCIKEDLALITKKTRVFMLPFPNIGEDGWVCWGSNNIGSNFKSLIGLDRLVDLLFNSPFNHDLFRGNSFADAGISSPKQLFEYIKDKDIFPDNLFVNSSRSHSLTIGDL